MLVRIGSHVVAERWDGLQLELIKGLPPTNIPAQEFFNNILVDLIDESMQCWVGGEQNEDGKMVVDTVAVTVIMNDGAVGMKTLLIYLASNLLSLDMDELKKFAQENGCNTVGFNCNNLDALKHLSEVGWKPFSVHIIQEV